MREIEKLKEEIKELKFKVKEHERLINWFKEYGGSDWSINYEREVDEHFENIEKEIAYMRKEREQQKEVDEILKSIENKD